MHGKTSLIRHHGAGVFAGLPEPLEATRYHCLVVDRASVPDCLEITAETDDGIVMGLRHRELAVEGVQFHPESILTVGGHDLLRNFLAQAPARRSSRLARRRRAAGVHESSDDDRDRGALVGASCCPPGPGDRRARPGAGRRCPAPRPRAEPGVVERVDGVGLGEARRPTAPSPSAGPLDTTTVMAAPLGCDGAGRAGRCG